MDSPADFDPSSRNGSVSDVSSSSNNIKVIARFRPSNQMELVGDGHQIVQYSSNDSCKIETKDYNGLFTFDRVFGPESKQSEIFDYSLKETVEDLMKGYNGTVLAYGQTGSGKSYTMMGPNIDDSETRGAIPRIVDQIFDMIAESPNDIEYIVRVSFMEIYMERIKDLLSPHKTNLPIHEEKNRGVYIKGLTEEYVSSAQEVHEVMRQGSRVRAVASTKMNQESSRSHSIFAISVAQKHLTTGSQKTGQLFLVDLAGSEKVGKTGASGQTLEEAKKINKSLSALGMVINSLTDGKSTHIPYRDSKLTRILQESLGGNSRTSLIVNCSPSSYNDAETISTLRFGVRAKTIKNKAKINAELSPSELRLALRLCQNQLKAKLQYSQQLESELSLWRTGTAPTKSQWISFNAQPDNSTAVNIVRPVTPSQSPRIPTDPDIIEDYMRRENELQDALSEKESIIFELEQALSGLKEELEVLHHRIENQDTDNIDNPTVTPQDNQTTDKLLYEKKELEIKVGVLEEQNEQLNELLSKSRQDLLELNAANTNNEEALSENREQKKQRKMDQIYASFSLYEDARSESSKSQLDEAIDLVEKLSISENNLNTDSSTLRQPEDKVKLLATLHNLRNIASSSISRPDGEDEVKYRDENQEGKDFSATGSSYATIHRLTSEIELLKSENQKLLLSSIGELEPTQMESPLSIETAQIQIRSLQNRIAQFEIMKTSLMRDLQDRCERVVELEISLDETRDQYNLALQNRNNKQQHKKMALLERNLEQLTLVQRKLIDQNSVLKKDVAVSQRLLDSRNDRIHSLETALKDSQTLLANETRVFESRLNFLHDRLVEVRSVKDPVGKGPNSNIIKPLRGGGPPVPPKDGIWNRINSYVGTHT